MLISLVVLWLVSGALAAAYEIGRPGTKERGSRRFVFMALCLLGFFPLFVALAPFWLVRYLFS